MRDRELTARTKLAFGVGQVAESIQLNTFDFFLFFYYVQVLHLDPILAGTATLLALVVDAVTDPAVGVLSDNCRSRLGRRHPFMYASAIPFGLMFYLLFSPPAGIADAALFVWLATFAIATRVSLTFFIVPYFAVGAELTENYRDRTSLVAYRTMFSFVSPIALSAVSFSVFFRATAEYAQGQLNPDAYPLFGITFAAVLVCAILASTAGTHRQIPFLHEVSREKGKPTGFAVLVRELTGLVKNRSFLAIFLMSITFFVAPGDIEPNVLFDLGLVYGPLVALFGLLCIYLFSFYDISRTSHEANLKTLQQRRRDGGAIIAAASLPSSAQDAT